MSRTLRTSERGVVVHRGPKTDPYSRPALMAVAKGVVADCAEEESGSGRSAGRTGRSGVTAKASDDPDSMRL